MEEVYLREKKREEQTFPSASFPRKSVRGFTYSARLVMLLVSDE